MNEFRMGSMFYRSVCKGSHNFSALSRSSSEGGSDLHVSFERERASIIEDWQYMVARNISLVWMMFGQPSRRWCSSQKLSYITLSVNASNFECTHLSGCNPSPWDIIDKTVRNMTKWFSCNHFVVWLRVDFKKLCLLLLHKIFVFRRDRAMI